MNPRPGHAWAEETRWGWKMQQVNADGSGDDHGVVGKGREEKGKVRPYQLCQALGCLW